MGHIHDLADQCSNLKGQVRSLERQLAAAKVAREQAEQSRDAFQNTCGELVLDNARLREALEKIMRRGPIMGSSGDYRVGQEHALEACADIARAALADAPDAEGGASHG